MNKAEELFKKASEYEGKVFKLKNGEILEVIRFIGRDFIVKIGDRFGLMMLGPPIHVSSGPYDHYRVEYMGTFLFEFDI